MRALALVALAVCSCGGDAGGGVLVVTVNATGTIPAVASFRVVATNAGQMAAAIAIPIAHGPTDVPPSQTFALAFDANRSGVVHLSVDALASDGTTIASGVGDAVVIRGAETMATVTLAGRIFADMGGDSAVVDDLLKPDLSAVVDARAPIDATAPVDATTPADLATVDLLPCGVCSPGQQRTIACGNCGMETDTCTQACQWAAGGCNGQGACAMGQTTACGMCGTSTCGNNCQWGSCNGQGICMPGQRMSCLVGGCDHTGCTYCDSTCHWGGCQCNGC